MFAPKKSVQTLVFITFEALLTNPNA